MAANEFTPWRDAADLLRVRELLYPLARVGGHDRRRQACSVISAWKLRGNLPHAVESTSLLVEATMLDNPRTESINRIRLCYVGALCRSV